VRSSPPRCKPGRGRPAKVTPQSRRAPHPGVRPASPCAACDAAAAPGARHRRPDRLVDAIKDLPATLMTAALQHTTQLRQRFAVARPTTLPRDERPWPRALDPRADIGPPVGLAAVDRAHVPPSSSARPGIAEPRSEAGRRLPCFAMVIANERYHPATPASPLFLHGFCGWRRQTPPLPWFWPWFSASIRSPIH